jgi:polyhydroxyalkanoate synthase
VSTSEDEQERELEALLELSRRGRAKLERLHEVLTTPGHFGTGATPAQVVYRENKLRLLRLLDDNGQPRAGRPAVLFVPAPVSRYFIVDLLPGRSFAGHVAGAGFDVFVIDFGTPTSEDRYADLPYYVDGLVRRSVRMVSTITGQPAINVVGYCLGGTLSLLYTALYPETVARLVPAAEVKSWFEMLAPGSNSLVGRVSDLWERLDDPAARLRDVRTMATWVDDVVPAPGRLLAELYRQFGPGRNGLMKGTSTVGNRVVELAAVRMPVLSVSAEKDAIAPPEGVDAIVQVVPHAEVLRLPGGHVGIVAGRTAASLWQRTVDFLATPRG